jgi:hypothetical protein
LGEGDGVAIAASFRVADGVGIGDWATAMPVRQLTIPITRKQNQQFSGD